MSICLEFVMKTILATLTLAAALAGCAGFGNTDDPPVARDAGFMEHPGTTFDHNMPGDPPMQAGPHD
jgi:hypothetical protein